MVDQRCYYEVLGVERRANSGQITEAYRKLAIRFHPDKNPGDDDAANRFKEAARAFEVLSDESLRGRYDRFGHAGLQNGGGGGQHDFNDMSDIFEAFGDLFGGGMFGGRGRKPRAQKGRDVFCEISLTLLEASRGVSKTIHFRRHEECTTCGGSGAKPGSGPTTCGTCGGAGQVRRATRTPFGNFTQVAECPTCGGTGQVIADPCSSCSGRGVREVRKKLRINIPAGVDTGTRLRVSGEGNAGLRGGPAGDLYVFLTVRSHPRLKRDGLNVLSDVKVSYLQAILGDTIEVETVDGAQEIELPAGSQPGSVVTLSNKGIPKLGNPVARGDQRITVTVELPSRILLVNRG